MWRVMTRCSFFGRWLPKAPNTETKTGRFKTERAHRSLAPKPLPQERPRPVVVRFHNFVDKQRVMNAAREIGRKGQPLKHGNTTVMIFQDFSASILCKHKRFDEVKKRLRSLGAEYSQLYPASLRVTYRGSSLTFRDPAEVEQYIESLKGTAAGDAWISDWQKVGLVAIYCPCVHM